MAFNCDLPKLNSELKRLKAFSEIAFTNIEGNEALLSKLINILSLFSVIASESITSSEESITFSVIAGSGLILNIDLATYSLSDLGQVEYEIDSSMFKAAGSLDGLIFMPLTGTFARYYKNRNSLKLPNGEFVTQNVNSFIVAAKPVYQRFAVDLIPEVIREEQEVLATIAQSQNARGFTTKPAVGDSVKIRAFDDLVAEYGMKTFTDSSGNTTTLAGSFSRIYGLPSFKEADYLKNYEAQIVKINTTTGIVELEFTIDGETKLEITEFRDDAGKVTKIRVPLKFHETQLRKI